MKNRRRESMAAVDWSELPIELLNLISQRFDIELDLIRFRSVCSTWRSSSIPNHYHILPFKYPYPVTFPNKRNTLFNPRNRGTSSSRHISKQNVYLIKPSPQQQQQQQQQENQTLLRPWLIRTSQTSHDKTKLFHPLLTNTNSVAISFTQLLDFSKFSVLQLRTNFITNIPYIVPEKLVAITCHGKKPLVLGTWASISPPPHGNDDENVNWKLIPDISIKYGDLCLYNGVAYAVDNTGRTIMVRPDDDSGVQLVAEPLIGGGNIKFLVESDGDLLLVDVYDSRLKIDLFKLNEKEKKWVKFTSLGDRVLFLGLVCSFSASASDLCVRKGNCVIFMDNIFKGCMYDPHVSRIFHLDQARVSPLSDYPEYFNLFSPPEWIVKTQKLLNS
ncbi:F-box protein SKIP23 [Trifolium repens]|nr:F-box protein SKIP23 [Trifolium repens]